MADKAKLLQVAQKHLSKGNLDKAIKTFNQLVEVDPRDQRLILRLADIQARAGRKKEAIENYEKVAAGFMRQDFTPKAIAVYKTILRLDPELLSAYEKLAELYKNQGLEAEALAQFENLFQVYEKKNDEDKQIDVLKLMADMDPENLGFQVRLGETLAKKGRKKEAAEAFAKAAATLSRRGYHDRASQLFEKITSLNPDNTAVRRELCAHYLESGQYNEARAEIEAILEIEPDDPRMVLLLGRILFQLGNKGEGEEKLAQSIQLFLNVGELESVMREFLFVAQSHLRNGEVDEAEAFYRQIMVSVPGEVRAIKGLLSVSETRKDRVGQINNLLLLGRTMQQSGDREGAAKAYQKANELDPLNEEAKSYLDGTGQVEVESSLETLEDQPVELEEAVLDADLEEIEEVEVLDAEESEPGDSFQVDPGEEVELHDTDEIGLEDTELDDFVEEVELLDTEDIELGDTGQVGLDQEVVELLETVDIEQAIDTEGDLDVEVQALDEAQSEEFAAVPDEPQVELVEEFEADALPDIVLEDFEDDEIVMEISGDVEGSEPTGIVEEQAPGVVDPAPVEMSLEELLAEVDVYERYGLGDKAAETLQKAKIKAPEDQRVLDRVAAFESAVRADVMPPIEGPVTREPAVVSQPPVVQDPNYDPFEEDLEEADFYHSQGLDDEASRIYQSILERDPQHLRASQALASIEGGGVTEELSEPEIQVPVESVAETRVEPVPEPPVEAVVETQFDPNSAREIKSKLIVEDSTPEDMGDFLDIADDLRSELADEFDSGTDTSTVDGAVSFEDIFSQFKKGIEETLGDEEYETHYNLGIAYKDMGLYDDAIREFESGTRDPALAQDSFSLMAMCYVEKRDYEAAVKAIEQALDVSTEGNKTGLFYQLGEVKERQKLWPEAVTAYEQVQNNDPAFEGIAEAIERAKSSISGDTLEAEAVDTSADGGMDDMLTDLIREVEEMARETSGETPDDPDKSKKDRISYL